MSNVKHIYIEKRNFLCTYMNTHREGVCVCTLDLHTNDQINWYHREIRGKSSHASVSLCTSGRWKRPQTCKPSPHTVQYVTPCAFLHMLACSSALHLDSFSLIKGNANGLYATNILIWYINVYANVHGQTWLLIHVHKDTTTMWRCSNSSVRLRSSMVTYMWNRICSVQKQKLDFYIVFI